MANYPCIIKATIVNEEKPTEICNVAGITFAENFAEAMEKTEGFYSDTLINCELIPLDYDDFMELPSVEIADCILKGE
jgi:hypothetical protein